MLIKVNKQNVYDFWRIDTSYAEYMRGKDIVIPFKNIQIMSVSEEGKELFSFWNFEVNRSIEDFKDVKYYFEVSTIIDNVLFAYSINICDDCHAFASIPCESMLKEYIEMGNTTGLSIINAMDIIVSEKAKRSIKEFVQAMMSFSVKCLLYSLCIFSERQTKERLYRYIGEPSVKRGIKKRGYSQIVLHDNIQAKICKEDVELIERIREKKYERHAEAWEVRGHLRRYKSGRVVYIKPYIKGHGRINKKEYVIK